MVLVFNSSYLSIKCGLSAWQSLSLYMLLAGYQQDLLLKIVSFGWSICKCRFHSGMITAARDKRLDTARHRVYLNVSPLDFQQTYTNLSMLLSSFCVRSKFRHREFTLCPVWPPEKNVKNKQ